MPDTPRDTAPAWRDAARRTARVAAGAALALMAWSAVHDILSGESDLTAEWTFLAFAGLLGVCLAMARVMRAYGAPR